MTSDHDGSEDGAPEPTLLDGEQLFHELAANLRQCIWIKDASTSMTGKMVYVSPAFETIFGISPDALIGRPHGLFEVVHPEDRERFRGAVTWQFERPYDVEYRVLHPDGSERWVWSRAAPVHDERGQVVRLVGISEDITARKVAENRIRELNRKLEEAYRRERQQSRTDELTGLGNRHCLREEAERLWKLAQRSAHKTGASSYLAAMLIDLDHLKAINDNHGHRVGDICLRAAAQRLSKSIREVDVPVRLGGDEFLVLLPHASEQEALLVAERVGRAVREAPVCAETGGGPDDMAISVSIGVAALDGLQEASVEDLIRRADEALYAAKQAGRRCVRGYDAAE